MQQSPWTCHVMLQAICRTTQQTLASHRMFHHDAIHIHIVLVLRTDQYQLSGIRPTETTWSRLATNSIDIVSNLSSKIMLISDQSQKLVCSCSETTRKLVRHSSENLQYHSMNIGVVPNVPSLLQFTSHTLASKELLSDHSSNANSSSPQT